ncbi:MAG: hypothetical protein WDM90_22255 [Ferruginibacter sp.]
MSEKQRHILIKIKKNGKIANDSILLCRREINKDSNKVFGINYNSVMYIHGPSLLSWSKFERYYNDSGQIIKEFEEPINVKKKVKYGSLEYEINRDETFYEYNNKNKIAKKIYSPIHNFYSISKYTKDTFHLRSINAKIDEYFYNDQDLEISRYHTDDSSRYLPTNYYKPSKAATCSYCHSRYLNQDETYYENGKLKVWTWYTSEGKIHSKKYFYYDGNSNLIKQVDSTGWYFETIPPYWESTTLYEYSDTGKVAIKTNNTETRFGSSIKKSITLYSSNGQVKSECSINDSTETCWKYFYKYEKNNLISIVSIDNDQNKLETYFLYDLKGFLIERKIIYKGRVTELTRFFYN